MSEQRMSSQLAESLEQSTFHCQRSEWEISPFLVVTIYYIPRLYLIFKTGRVCVLPPWKEVHGDIWDQQTRDGRPHHNFLQGELLMLVLVLGGLIHFFRWEAELPRWEINLPKWDTRASRWATCYCSPFCHARTCELSLLLKLLSPGISRKLCRVGVPRGPGWKMKNRTCDQDLSRHNNWCLHLIFISISERRRIVFLPCWLGEPWQKCFGRGRRKDCDHLHWMREIFIAGLSNIMSIRVINGTLNKVKFCWSRKH